MIQWKAETYKPVGHCIYCGATADLTDEHIIPFALLPRGGDWFLPKASCPDCADNTKRFEGIVCGAMFGPLREKLRLKSRRKKTGQLSARYNYPDGSLIDQTISVSDFPSLCFGFKWPIPGILIGSDPTSQRPCRPTDRCWYARRRPSLHLHRSQARHRRGRRIRERFFRAIFVVGHRGRVSCRPKSSH